MFYVWRNKMRKPTFDGGEQHQCVNWDELETWVDSRGFDPFTPGLLMHPTLGEFEYSTAERPRGVCH